MSKQPIRNNLIIELHIPDFDKAKKFYGVLGFEVILEHPVTDTAPGYMVLKRHDEMGDSIINFYGGNEQVYQQSYFKRFPSDTKRGYATSLTIPVSNIDSFFKQVSSAIPAHVMQEVQEKKDGDMKWRDFRLEDPFGFYLRFTELIDWGQ
jgi:catechol 2,3-dioxygenase-like lactoylglutathione lyase family enzyme